MIAKFFSKTNPIHFIITSAVLFIAFIITKIVQSDVSITLWFLVKQLALFGVCFFSLFIFDFLVSKNKLTKKNSYQILFYVLFMVLMPQTFLNSKLVIANLFILFAVRRIVSLRSKKQQKKKILDATIWISLATLLYFWSILFFILIFAALFLYKISDIKNWFIPLIGLVLFSIITYAVLIVFNISLTDFISKMDMRISLDFSSLNQQGIVIAATIFFSYFLWTLVYYISNLKNKSKSYRPTYMLILITAIISIGIVIISPDKSGTEFIFFIAPLAIMTTNYLELVSEKWFKEILIWILIIALLVILIL